MEVCFNHSKSGVVTFGETKPQHFESLKDRKWFLGDTKVEVLYEYKKLDVFKNYVASVSFNTDDNIDKTRKKLVCYFLPILIVGKSVLLFMLSSACLPACLPTLLYGAELFMLTPTLLLRLERCQSWFLKNVFYVPKFAPLLLALSCVKSVESEIVVRKLLLLGRLIKEPKMSPAMKSLFHSRTKASLNQILHHWAFCLALRRHYINMSYFITSKIGITALHSRFIKFVLLGKNGAG